MLVHFLAILPQWQLARDVRWYPTICVTLPLSDAVALSSFLSLSLTLSLSLPLSLSPSLPLSLPLSLCLSLCLMLVRAYSVYISTMMCSTYPTSTRDGRPPAAPPGRRRGRTCAPRCGRTCGARRWKGPTRPTSLSLSPHFSVAILAQAILAQVRNRSGSGVAASLRRTAFFGFPGAMGSKAALGDIQRLLNNLNRQFGSAGPGGGRPGKGHGNGANVGENWDCPHRAEGTDNFAT